MTAMHRPSIKVATLFNLVITFGYADHIKKVDKIKNAPSAYAELFLNTLTAMKIAVHISHCPPKNTE